MNKDAILKSRELIRDCDAVLIGAGAGLSSAAGLSYSGKRFSDHFPDFIKKYDLTDMYSSAFYPFPSQEEFWAYFSRHIALNRYDEPVAELYQQLLSLVADKNYFVITSNCDAQFFRAGFDADRIFAVQGDYGNFQCSKACHSTLYSNEESIRRMTAQQKDMKIPTELIPKCPVCGEEMAAHLRKDDLFIENSDWVDAQDRYFDFLDKNCRKKCLLMEFGVGFNTPVIIRWPFEEMAEKYSNMTLIRVNRDSIASSRILGKRHLMLKMDLSRYISDLLL